MFNFLKKKLKEWVKPKPVVVLKPKKKPEKKEEKPKKAKLKIKHEKRTEQELKQERKLGEEVIEDIKKENQTEEIKAIPQLEIEKETEEKAEEEIEEEKPKKSFWEKIGLVKKYKITEEDFNELFESLETILLENNVALEVVDYLRENLKKELINLEVNKNEIEKIIKQALKISIESLFSKNINFLEKIKEKARVSVETQNQLQSGGSSEPFVIVFFGANGSGKTTTLAKISNFLKQKNISSILAAADTFRAASIEQLSKHGEKLGVKVIKQDYGSDPAAVAYDACEYAKAKKIKVVLIDTAGRMHTKASLIKEMEKIVRVSKPDMKIFVAEATLGNDAIEQAKIFNEAIGIDGIILSKQDVDEKGGTSLSVSYVTGKPILFLGTGQKLGDLEEFDREKIIKQLDL